MSEILKNQSKNKKNNNQKNNSDKIDLNNEPELPEEIEEKLTKSIYIEEALVFSPNDIDIQAVLYPNMDEVNEELARIGEKVSPDNIWELIKLEVRKTNTNLESYKRVRQFAIRVEEFPKTTTRKIKRYLFKELELKPDAKFIWGYLKKISNIG